MICDTKSFSFRISIVSLICALGTVLTNEACFAEPYKNNSCNDLLHDIQNCANLENVFGHAATKLYASSSLSGLIQSQHSQATNESSKTIGTNNFSQSTGNKKNDVIYRVSLLDEIGKEDFKICATLLPQQKLQKWQIVKLDEAPVPNKYTKTSYSEQVNFQNSQENCELFFDLIFGN